MLFEPFETSQPGDGHTGLWLHLVHNWVHQILQGDLEVSSQPGQGTKIKIILPVKVQAPDQSVAEVV